MEIRTHTELSAGLLQTIAFSTGLPDVRRRGIARQLLKRQHDFARALGYSIVRTQTKNKYREMLLLNIACGFDVTGVTLKSGEKFQSIILARRIEPLPR